MSTAEGRITYLGDASKAAPNTTIHTANKFAKGASEVLVEGEIPYEKIRRGEGSGKLWCPG